MTCRRLWSLDYSPQGCKESDTVERLSMHGAWTHCITPVRGSACSTAVSMQRPYGFFLVWHGWISSFRHGYKTTLKNFSCLPVPLLLPLLRLSGQVEGVVTLFGGGGWIKLPQDPYFPIAKSVSSKEPAWSSFYREKQKDFPSIFSKSPIKDK